MKAIAPLAILFGALVAAGCSAAVPTNEEAIDDVALGLGGCSMDQIREAQAQCVPACAQYGGSRGVHYCDARQGGYISPCACVSDVPDLFVTNLPPPPAGGGGGSGGSNGGGSSGGSGGSNGGGSSGGSGSSGGGSGNGGTGNGGGSGGGSGSNEGACIAAPNPDTACMVRFWSNGATNIESSGETLRAAFLRWGLNSGSPAPFSAESPGGPQLMAKILADPSFKTLLDARLRERLDNDFAYVRIRVAFSDPDLAAVLQGERSVDVYATKSNPGRTSLPVGYSLRLQVSASIDMDQVATSTGMTPELDTLRNSTEIYQRVMGVLKDFNVQAELVTSYTLTN